MQLVLSSSKIPKNITVIQFISIRACTWIFGFDSFHYWTSLCMCTGQQSANYEQIVIDDHFNDTKTVKLHYDVFYQKFNACFCEQTESNFYF